MGQTDTRPYKLENYRGDIHADKDDALRSGPRAVEDFLSQFEGSEKTNAALVIVAAALEVISEETDGTIPDYYARVYAEPKTVERLGNAGLALSWVVDIAGTSRGESGADEA